MFARHQQADPDGYRNLERYGSISIDQAAIIGACREAREGTYRSNGDVNVSGFLFRSLDVHLSPRFIQEHLDD